MSTALNLAALAAQGELKIPIARGVVSQGGSGTDYTGWSGVSSVFVEAKVEVREQSRGFATLTLTVEGSSNGSDWSTLETFTFGHGGTQSATVSSPDDHLRVSWDVGGGSEWQIIEVTAAPSIIDTGGGGGSLPDPIVDPVTIDAPDVSSDGGIDRVFGVVDQSHEITVDWVYDGATDLTATITGGYAGVYASLNATDDDSSVPHGYFVQDAPGGSIGHLVLAITNIGFESGGPDFHAHVHVPIGMLGGTSTTQQFSFGTPRSLTAIYRTGGVEVAAGTLFAREGLQLPAASQSETIWITAAEIPGASGIGAPIFRLSSADGFTDLFVLNRFGGITLVTADSSPPLIVPNIPTEDPHVPGALWSDSGVITMSDGIAP